MIAVQREDYCHPGRGGIARGGRASGGRFNDGMACCGDNLDWATACTTSPGILVTLCGLEGRLTYIEPPRLDDSNPTNSAQTFV